MEFKELKIGDKITNLPSLKRNPEEDIIEAEFVAYDPTRDEVIIRHGINRFSRIEKNQRCYWEKI